MFDCGRLQYLKVLFPDKLIGGQGLLVIHTVPKPSVPEGEKVAVTGVLRSFVLAELEREYDRQWDLTLKQKLEAEYTNKSVLVARGVYLSAIPVGCVGPPHERTNQ